MYRKTLYNDIRRRKEIIAAIVNIVLATPCHAAEAWIFRTTFPIGISTCKGDVRSELRLIRVWRSSAYTPWTLQQVVLGGKNKVAEKAVRGNSWHELRKLSLIPEHLQLPSLAVGFRSAFVLSSERRSGFATLVHLVFFHSFTPAHWGTLL